MSSDLNVIMLLLVGLLFVLQTAQIGQFPTAIIPFVMFLGLVAALGVLNGNQCEKFPNEKLTDASNIIKQFRQWATSVPYTAPTKLSGESVVNVENEPVQTCFEQAHS